MNFSPRSRLQVLDLNGSSLATSNDASPSVPAVSQGPIYPSIANFPVRETQLTEEDLGMVHEKRVVIDVPSTACKEVIDRQLPLLTAACHSSPRKGSGRLEYLVPPGLLQLKAVKHTCFVRVLVLAMVFFGSFSVVVALFMTLPKPGALIDRGRVSSQDGENSMALVLKIPKDLAELKIMRATLGLYQKENQFQVALVFVTLYVFLQTFMVPGSIFLNLLAGSMFGFYKGLALVTILSATGASCCYFLSSFVLKDLIYSLMPEQCDWLTREVQHHRHNLFHYLLFLRIQPVVPAWFINLAAPVVSIPFWPFFIGTLVGFLPYHVIGIKAGGVLSELQSVRELFNMQTVCILLLIATLALVPVCIKHTSLNQSNSPWGSKRV
eukprot:jgi/Mesen1/5362/ME000267S04509